MKAKYKKGQKIISVGDFEKSSATFFRVIFGNNERTKHSMYARTGRTISTLRITEQ